MYMPRPDLLPHGPFFRSTAQAAVLHRLALATGAWITLDSLADVDARELTIRRELRRLVDAGVVERDTSVRPFRFRLDPDAPVTAPLVRLLELTVGVEPTIAAALERVDGIVAAAIHGSWAAEHVTPTSDIDVLVVVEDAAERHVIDAVRDAARSAESIVGRDVDVMVYPRAELVARLQGGSGFLRDVVGGPLVELVGSVEQLVDGAVPR